MELITKEQREKLLENARVSSKARAKDGDVPDFIPVVKLFLPAGAATWLLTELYEEEQNIAFGLCDLGMGFAELGYVSINELEEIRAPMRGFKRDGTSFAIGYCMVERDLYFKPTKTLSQYADEARAEGRIVA